MSSTYHTPIVNGATNDKATWNNPLSALDSQLVTNAAQIAALNTSGVGSVYAQINNASGEADTSWVVDNISGTFLAGATVVYSVSGVVYASTVAANATTSPLTVTGAPGVTIPDNTVISQVPAGIAGKVLESVRNVVEPTFGADATGATESLTAISTAITNASAGETVYFPKGTYDLGTGDITIPDGVILRGDGATLSVDSGRRCFTIGSNVQIHGLKFDGNDNASANTTSRFFQIQDETNVLIQNCEFNSMGNRPISIGGSTNIRVVDCTFTNQRQDLGSTCIGIGGNDANTAGSSNVVVKNCFFVNADIDDGGAAGLIIAGDHVNDLQVEHVLIDGCYFKYMGRDYTGGTPGPRGDVDIYNDVNHIKIINCTSINSGHGLTKLDDTQDCLIEGNTIINSKCQGLVFGYRYGNNLPHSARIVNNYLYNCGVTTGVDGIDISGDATSAPANYVSDVLVQGNIIDTTGRYGIQATEVTRLRIDNNIIRTPTNQGIYAFNATAIAAEVPIAITNNTVQVNGTASGIATRPRDDSAAGGALIVTGNTVSDITSTGVGIDVYQTNMAAIANNVFHDIPAGSEYRLTTVTLRAGSLNGVTRAYTAGTVTLVPNENIRLDSSGGAITATLPSGNYDGQICVIRMTNATASSTVSVTAHETSSPEVFTFSNTTHYAVLMWTVNRWITIKATATV